MIFVSDARFPRLYHLHYNNADFSVTNLTYIGANILFEQSPFSASRLCVCRNLWLSSGRNIRQD